MGPRAVVADKHYLDPLRTIFPAIHRTPCIVESLRSRFTLRHTRPRRWRISTEIVIAKITRKNLIDINWLRAIRDTPPPLKHILLWTEAENSRWWCRVPCSLEPLYLSHLLFHPFANISFFLVAFYLQSSCAHWSQRKNENFALLPPHTAYPVFSRRSAVEWMRTRMKKKAANEWAGML